MAETAACYVYVIGHEHAIFGHAVKVGVSSNAYSRMASLQTANVEELVMWLALRFDSRDAAFEVERLFHESELAGPIRGEWVGCDPVEVIYYLTCITADVLRRRVGALVPSQLAEARANAGLLKAFEMTDAASDEQHEVWNGRINEWFDHRDYVAARQ